MESVRDMTGGAMTEYEDAQRKRDWQWRRAIESRATTDPQQALVEAILHVGEVLERIERRQWDIWAEVAKR